MSWIAAGVGPIVVVALVTLGYAASRWFNWPDIEALRTANPATTAFIERYERRTGEQVDDVAHPDPHPPDTRPTTALLGIDGDAL